MNSPVIDLHDYLDMEIMDQLIVLRNNGVEIGRVNTGPFLFRLFALGSYYVEVRTGRNGKVPVHTAVPFVKGPRLDKYLETIDLSPLL